MLLKLRPYIIGLFLVLSLASVFFASRLRFSFSFDQFFPEGDPDLEFYQEFSKEFGTDDNFLLIALENQPDIFDSLFLARTHSLALDLRSLPLVSRVQSLTTLQLPVKTPFGISLVPAIHLQQPDLYSQDKELIFKDKRWKYNLIDSAATSLVIAATTKENLTVQEAESLVSQVDSLLELRQVSSKAHILGRSFFQKELIDFQKKEMALAFIASILLVSVIMVILYRKPAGIIISLGSIALSLLLFLGYLGATGSELNAISALFPVIMLIVGSSDVIHIFSKYLDELEKNQSREESMRITIREIGLATFMTSFTTAIGFASLATSRLHTIRDFGWDAAAGVMIAYVTVILLTTTLLSYYQKDQLFHQQRGAGKWQPLLQWILNTTQQQGNKIFILSIGLLLLFGVGITWIHTNYRIENNLPKNSRVLSDYYDQRTL
ncbi:MAG: MMPL family transporter [Saprospiraceae bacterium]|nr:MMPL family transporter [Saprospiraceae bacterium]